MLRRLLVVAAFLFLPTTVQAQGLHLSTDIGITKFFDGGPTGFGLDVFPGYDLGNGLIIEGQLGVHRGAQKVGAFAGTTFRASVNVIPFEVGARYVFDVGDIKPFAGAHLGLARLGNCAGGGGGCTGRAGFGFNIGGGANYQITDMIGVGLATWFHSVHAGGGRTTFNGVTVRTGGGSMQMFNFGAHASFEF